MANPTTTSRPTWTKVVSIVLAILMVAGVGIGVVYGVQMHQESEEVSAKERSQSVTVSKVSSRHPIGYDGFLRTMTKQGYVPVAQSYDHNSISHDIGMRSPKQDYYYIYIDATNITYGEAIFKNLKATYVSDLSSSGKGEDHTYTAPGYEKLTKKTKNVYYCLARINNQIIFGMSISPNQDTVNQTIQSFGF